MSIALERSNNRVGSSGLIRRQPCMSSFEPSESGRDQILQENLCFPMNNLVNKVSEVPKELDSCSSSSIGRNSDSSGRLSVESDGEDETEAQSSYKGPLDTMDSLEEVLPIRKGISKFYCGKSKSFTSLSEATASSSIKDLAKPNNAYTKKRKNLLACSNIILGVNDNRYNNSLSKDVGRGISSSKRPTNSNRRSKLPISTGASSSDSNNKSENSSSSSSPPLLRPPLHPSVKSSLNNESSSPPTAQRNSSFSPWRSFSLTDLRRAAAADESESNRRTDATSTTSNRGDHKPKRLQF